MKQIKILGEAIKIKYVYLEDDHGQYHHDKRTIYLSEKHDPETLEATIFHEAVHAALAISGLNEVLGSRTEEAVVRCIEHAIYPLIKGFSKKEL